MSNGDLLAGAIELVELEQAHNAELQRRRAVQGNFTCPFGCFVATRLKVKRAAEKRKANRLARKKNARLKRVAEKKNGKRKRCCHMAEFVHGCNVVYPRDGGHAFNQFLAKLRKMSVIPVEVPSGLDRYRSILDHHFKDGNQWQITIPRQLFHYEHFDIPIGKEEIERWLDQDEIEACHISVYIRYLVENYCTGVEDMFGFLCPNRISPGYVGGSLEDRAKYIGNAMEGNIHNKVFLGPYNPGGHWVLIVFSPQFDYAYWIDPLHGQIREDAMRLVDMSHALKYAELGGVKPRLTTLWRRIECPLQNMLDCGYYVMRFMREIIHQRCLHIPCNWFDHKTTYLQADIDEIRIEWMEFLFDINT